tara:strand:- start:58 stop:1299 length:1242 start_codon:yes stop_codon:yes gene_type:complete
LKKIKKPYFYYGWVIVVVMAIANAVGMGMGALNLGLYIKPMGDSLGISRASFGWASTIRSFSSAATNPLLGNLLDKYGARWILAICILITGISMISLSFVKESWQLILVFGLMGFAGVSGPGSIVTSVPPAKWFIEKRGKALAITSVGISIGAALFIPLTQILINNYSWESAWFVLGILGIILVCPISIIFVRRQPEDIGLLPDGKEKLSQHSVEDSSLEEYSFTLNQALKTSSLWLLTIAFSILNLAIFTFALHRIPAFMDRGLDPTLVSLATAFDAICAGIASFTGGILVTKIPSKIIGASAFMMLAIASLMTIYANEFWLMFFSMAIFGAGIGINSFTQNYIWAEYFGRNYLGQIRGFVTPISLVLGGIGAPLAGYVLDITGSYNPAWWVSVWLMIFAAIIFYLSPKPKH